MFDIVIIGGGPSGLTAAIYVQRMGKKALIIEKNAPGGRMLNTHLVENYPGIDSITGGQLSINIFNQATKFGTQFEFGASVIDIKHNEKTKINEIFLDNGKVIPSLTVYITSGSTPKLLNLQNTDKFFGNGISTCVICDGSFARGGPIAIIGGGNSAAEEAIFARSISSHVYIINRLEEIIAEKVILNKLKTFENVTILNSSEVVKYLGEDKITGVRVKNSISGKEIELDVNYIFLYIGSSPNTNFAKKLNILDENGYIKIDPWTMKTNIASIFAGGDVVPRKFKQISISTSDGTIAALEAIKYIDENF